MAFGPATIIVVDAGTFLLSAATLLAMRLGPVVRFNHNRRAPRSGLAQFARRTPLFPAVLLMTGVLSLTAAGVVSVALPALAADRFADGPRVFGYLLAGLGAGLLAGTLVAGTVRWPRRSGLVALALLAGHGAVLLAVPYLGMLEQVAALFLLGVVDGALGVLVLTILQRLPPENLRGRVMAAFTVVRTSTYPLAVALAGLVVSGWGAAVTVTVAGMGVIGVTVLGAAMRVVREA